MKTSQCLTICACLTWVSSTAIAAGSMLPMPATLSPTISAGLEVKSKTASKSRSDDSTGANTSSIPRVRFVDYKDDEVITVLTSMGVVTRIILGSDEKITRHPDTGFPSICDQAAHEWCIRAEAGDNQITVKPKPGATRNNLELSTDKRDYSFSFITTKGAESASGVPFRVVMRYAMPRLPSAHVQIPPASVPLSTEHKVVQKPASPLARPVVRNIRYTSRSDDLGRDAIPSIIFDDGRFTYMKFERAREIPAVFAVDGNGQEMRVAFHSDRLLSDPHRPTDAVEPDYLVVRRVARTWRLRLGAAVAEITNDAFDPKGIETHNGTTTPALRREIKE